jgi:hypothetical protein
MDRVLIVSSPLPGFLIQSKILVTALQKAVVYVVYAMAGNSLR